MNDVFLMDWWLKKYIPKIIEFIAVAIEYEELTPEELEIKRRELLLEYLDSCESHILIYLFRGEPLSKILEVIYEKVYSPIPLSEKVNITDNVNIVDTVSAKVGKK